MSVRLVACKVCTCELQPTLILRLMYEKEAFRINHSHLRHVHCDPIAPAALALPFYAWVHTLKLLAIKMKECI